MVVGVKVKRPSADNLKFFFGTKCNGHKKEDVIVKSRYSESDLAPFILLGETGMPVRGAAHLLEFPEEAEVGRRAVTTYFLEVPSLPILTMVI
ncbi:MAG: hypothetical protein Q7U16_14290 [Agitococcus sp.]|nr:hypothetical protein [Agitococcus sp.]